MAEENGEIILKAPESNLRAFIDAESNDISAILSELFEYAGIDQKHSEREHYEFYSAQLESGYLKLAYNCSEWSYIASAIVRFGKSIELYAKCENEYGTLRYFALTEKERKFMFSIDLESDQMEDEDFAVHAIDQISEWISRVPDRAKKSFPDFCEVDTHRIAPNTAEDLTKKKKKKKKPQVNLNCRFMTPITEEQITKILDKGFNKFYLKRFEKSKLVGDGGYWEKHRIQTMKLKPERFETYTVAEWFPISDNRDKTAKDLIEILSAAGLSPTYAINFFGEKSSPYRILLCDGNGVKTIFDSGEYSDKELKALCDDTNDEVDMEINWFSLEFEQIAFMHEKYGLKEYAEERLSTFRKKFNEDSEQHKKIWANHPGMQEPLLQDLELAFFYRHLDEASADSLVHTLQAKGMHKGSVQADLSAIAGENAIVVPKTYKEAAEWLIKNIQELQKHRIVVDNDLVPVVVINMS